MIVSWAIFFPSKVYFNVDEFYWDSHFFLSNTKICCFFAFSQLVSLVLQRFHGIYSFIIVRFIIYFSFLPDKGVLGQKNMNQLQLLWIKQFSTFYNGFGMQILLFPLVERSLTKPILQRHLPGLLQTPFTHGSGQCALHLWKQMGKIHKNTQKHAFGITRKTREN